MISVQLLLNGFAKIVKLLPLGIKNAGKQSIQVIYKSTERKINPILHYLSQWAMAFVLLFPLFTHAQAAYNQPSASELSYPSYIDSTSKDDTLDQEADYATIDEMNRKARITALKSALVPGWGQANNEQYWKIPVAYAALGATIFFWQDNHNKFKEFQKAYNLRTDGDTSTLDKFAPGVNNREPKYFSADGLQSAREFHRRYRDLNIILTGLVYVANILDAYVYAHLKDFDVSDNIAMSINTLQIDRDYNNQPSFKVGVTLKLK